MASQPDPGNTTTSTLDLTFLVKEHDGEFAGLCLELDIAACGQSVEDAIEALKGLIELYVLDCVAMSEIPVPLRPATRDAIAEFLRPPMGLANAPLFTHREVMPVYAPA
ncbi:MAG TPA: hypothetical protein VMY87_06390 [Armatimonadota bacterium]|nr:hypothetical protein [Armatimonadota bacterium]